MTEMDAHTQQHFQQQHERAYYEQAPDRPVLLSFIKDWLNQRAWTAGPGPQVLDVGCGRGWLAQQLRLCFPAAQIDGVEINRQACQEARESCENLYEQPVEVFLAEQHLHHQYDYIILADILEHLIDPWTVLKQMKKGLNEPGRIIVSLPNVGHYTVISSLLLGRWQYTDAGLLDRTHLRFFTLQEALQMFQDTGLITNDIKFTSLPRPQIVDQMAALAAALGADANRFKQEAEVFEYVFLLSPVQTGTDV